MARLRLRPSSREKELSTKGHEGVGGKSRGIRQRLGRGKRFPGRGKKISTKGHEERQRATKGLEKAQEGSAKGREGSAKGWEGGKDFQEGAKRYPRRATKNGKGPLRGWRRLKKDLPKVGQGEKISRKGQKDIHEGPRRGWRRPERDPPEVAKGRERISRKRQKDFHEGPRRTAKGHEGVGGGPRGIHQRSPRGEKGFPGKGKKISTKDNGAIRKGDPDKRAHEI